MIHLTFVTKTDPNYLFFLSKRIKQKEKTNPTSLQIFSRICETAIQQILASSDEIIIKETLPNNENARPKHTFKEVDYHLPDKKIVGEIKVSFDTHQALKSAKRQHKAIAENLSSLGYSFQYLIIDAKDTKIKEILIDTQPTIRLSGGSLFDYCLNSGLIEDVGLYERVIGDFKRVSKLPFINS
jgi:hypothetical protein